MRYRTAEYILQFVLPSTKAVGQTMALFHLLQIKSLRNPIQSVIAARNKRQKRN
jgi:hypothetical protein